MKRKALFKAVKEPLRLLVLALVPFGIAYFNELNYEWAMLAVVVLKFVDKYLHEISKVQPVKDRREGLGGVKGLTGF